MNTQAQKRCRERIPDNGDDYACDNPLPCPQHLPEQTVAHELLDAIHAKLGKPYALKETYRGRVLMLGRLIDAYRAKHPDENDPLDRLLAASRRLDLADKDGTDEAHQEAECDIWQKAIEWSRATA